MPAFFLETTSTEWTSLIFQYGPSALVVLFVFVLLLRKPPASGNSKVDTTISSALWLCLLCLVAVTVVAWWRTNFPSEFVVKGTLSTLRAPAFIDTMETMYLHKKPTAGRDFEYEWRYISNSKEERSIELLLQNDPKSPQVWKYQLPVNRSLYDGVPVTLSLDKGLVMTLTHGKDSKQIQPEVVDSIVSVDINAHSPKILNLSVVYAADGQISPQELVSALDADDPVVRATAKKNLVAMGGAALPSLAQGLSGNYRTKVEVLSTINLLKASIFNQLTDTARCMIMTLGEDDDQVLRSQAMLIIGSGMILPIGCRCTVTDLGNGRSLRFIRGPQPIFIYLSKQYARTQNAADFYVSDTDPNTLNGNLDQALFEKSQSHPQSTRKLSTTNRRSADVTINNNSYTLGITTHYVLGYVAVKTCSNR